MDNTPPLPTDWGCIGVGCPIELKLRCQRFRDWHNRKVSVSNRFDRDSRSCDSMQDIPLRKPLCRHSSNDWLVHWADGLPSGSCFCRVCRADVTALYLDYQISRQEAGL